MHVGVVGHREARLHGTEIVPGLDLRRGQGHRCVVVNVVEGDLLDVRLDIVQAVIEERALGVDGRRSLIRCQLKVLQLHR